MWAHSCVIHQDKVYIWGGNCDGQTYAEITCYHLCKEIINKYSRTNKRLQQ